MLIFFLIFFFNCIYKKGWTDRSGGAVGKFVLGAQPFGNTCSWAWLNHLSKGWKPGMKTQNLPGYPV